MISIMMGVLDQHWRSTNDQRANFFSVLPETEPVTIRFKYIPAFLLVIAYGSSWVEVRSVRIIHL